MSLHENDQLPEELTEETEQPEPERAFTSFFENFDLPESKELLKEAMTLVVEKRFKGKEFSIEEDDVRFFFEKVEKVLEAAWVMKD